MVGVHKTSWRFISIPSSHSRIMSPAKKPQRSEFKLCQDLPRVRSVCTHSRATNSSLSDTPLSSLQIYFCLQIFCCLRIFCCQKNIPSKILHINMCSSNIFLPQTLHCQTHRSPVSKYIFATNIFLPQTLHCQTNIFLPLIFFLLFLLKTMFVVSNILVSF